MTRALVLSGGGSVGIAWQTGLIAGLARFGLDLRGADLVVGTSAGSAVGARLAAGADLEERLRSYDDAAPRREAPAGASSGGAAAAGIGRLMTVMAEAAAHEDEEAGRAAIGRFALEADAMPEERFLRGFADLAGHDWPEAYACTAVDAETGAFVVWSSERPAPLDRAVASSCCVPGIFAPITIGGRRYIDGGMRSVTNADLATGHGAVLLISLVDPARMAGVPDARAQRFAKRIEAELDALAASGATVEVIAPDDAAAAAIGDNLMDAAAAPGGARAGLRQAADVADRVRSLWA